LIGALTRERSNGQSSSKAQDYENETRDCNFGNEQVMARPENGVRPEKTEDFQMTM
jgi:hypothetical protein